MTWKGLRGGYNLHSLLFSLRLLRLVPWMCSVSRQPAVRRRSGFLAASSETHDQLRFGPGHIQISFVYLVHQTPKEHACRISNSMIRGKKHNIPASSIVLINPFPTLLRTPRP